MSARVSEEIRKSLKPIFLSSWVFGVPRVSYKYSYRIIYSAIVSAIYVATFSATFDSRMNIVSGFNTTMVISYISSQFVMFAGGIGTIVFWVAKGARALEDAIIELAQLDVELKGLGMEDVQNSRKLVRRQIELISLFLALWVMIVIMYEYIIDFMKVNDNVTVFKIFCLAYSSHGPHLLVLFGELVFSTIMHMFYQRFRWINQILRKYWKDQECSHAGRTFRVVPGRNGSNLSTRTMTQTEELLVKIERLYKVHQRLCGITETVNSSFSWQLYFAVSVTFSLVIYRLLVLYSFAFLRLEQLAVRVVLNIVWIIYYMLKFWMITLTCTSASDEANKLGIMLYGVAIDDERYHGMLRQYSIQLNQNKLRFTAGGFFPIDLTLVNSLISHLTTYILFAVDVWTDTEKKHSQSGTVTNDTIAVNETQL